MAKSKVMTPCEPAEYLDAPHFSPTRLRIWCEYGEDGRWYIDGYDPDRRLCTEVIWDEDTFPEIVARIPEFTERLKEIYRKE